MTASKTPFAGITRIPPGESLSQDGYAFQDTDRAIIDLLLRLGGVTHKHDGHTGLTDPVIAPTLGKSLTGGEIPANLPIYVTYTLQDANGGETLPVATETITTDAGFTDPFDAPNAVVSYAAGTLLASNLSYAVTVRDGVGGETALGPLTSVVIEPGNANAEVTLSNLATALADSSGGAAGAIWALWRQQDGGPWYLIATGTSDTFVDNGVAGDCSVSPPNSSTTQGTNALFVTVPTGQPAGTSRFSIYVSLDGSFTNPALLGNYPASDLGVEKTYTSLTTLDGAPPAVSTCWPGANQIDFDTDIINRPILPPVATTGGLPTVGVPDGALCVVLADHSVHVWESGSWAAVGGGGGGTDVDPAFFGPGSVTISGGTDYAFVKGQDDAHVVDITNPSDMTLTIDTYVNEPFVPGDEIEICRRGDGNPSIAVNAGIMVHSPTGSFKPRHKYSVMRLRCVNYGEWVLSGDLDVGTDTPGTLSGPDLDASFRTAAMALTPLMYYRLQSSGGLTPEPDVSGNGHNAVSGAYGDLPGPWGPGDNASEGGVGYLTIPAAGVTEVAGPWTVTMMYKAATSLNQGMWDLGGPAAWIDNTNVIHFQAAGVTLTAPVPAGVAGRFALYEFVAKDANGDMAIWVDGRKLARVAAAAATGGGSSGGYFGRGGGHFGGSGAKYTECIVYDAALTDSQLVGLYDASPWSTHQVDYERQVAADTPEAWYRLDTISGGVTPDISGNGHDATVNGAPTLVQGPWGAGSYGMAGFSAADHVTLPNGVQVDLSGGFTIEVLLQVSYNEAQWGLLDLDSSHAAPVRLLIDDNNAHVTFDVNALALVISSAWTLEQGSDDAGRYKILTFVADDASGDLAVWWEGVKRGTLAWSSQGGVISGGVLGYIAAISKAFDGRVAQLSIYSSALADARITAHHSASGL